VPRSADGQKVGPDYGKIQFFHTNAPASDLLAMFCKGTIRISNDIRHRAFIAGENAFGRMTVTAKARVDDS
jgi:hypothetical protein